jgi:hydrogenase maturation protease
MLTAIETMGSEAAGTQSDVPGPKTLVLGLGNDLLCDDAIGLRVARVLRERLVDLPGVQVEECSEMGLALLDFVIGFDTLVLVDAIQLRNVPPGSVHALDADQLQALPQGGPHFLGVSEVLALGSQLGLSVPSQVKIFAIEVEDPYSIQTEMTSPLNAALPGIVERLEAAVVDIVRS